MSTSNFFKSIVAVALCAVVSVSGFAQKVTTSAGVTVTKTGAAFPADVNYIDMVSVNSKIPYTVTPDATVASLVTSNPAVFHASVFNWAVSGAGGVFQIPASATVLTAAPAPDAATHFVENAVAIKWGAVAGTYTISVSERPQNTAGIPVCDGQSETLDAWVMAKPIVNFDEAATPNVGAVNIIGTAGDGILGGCGIAAATPTNVLLAVDLTGTDQYQVYYKVDYYSLANATAIPDAAGTFTPTPTKFDENAHTYLTVGSATAPNTGTVNTNAEIEATVGAIGSGTEYGKWIITLQGVTDRISRKSLALDPVTGLANQDLGTLGATSTLTLYSLPTPTTGKIQHVTNLGW